MRRRALIPLATALAMMTAMLSACSSGEDGPARRTAERFYDALGGGQGDTACRLLTPRTAEQVPSDGQDCAASIVKLGLKGGGVRTSAVWGDEAQVRLASDTVFLHRFAQGWLVRAAGCRARGEQPYDCKVGG
ncbi:hypothetical protein [Sphaerisporangium fuscum]|uniref:hypothetical protein n=1 Tax=Sphaerisporangium fuscum TaxID=2835868 RepID=UPI001BDBBC94|nr:hypothetical protein [Sphaerisporangium fuscum]